MNLQQITESFLANDNIAFRYIYTNCSQYCIESLQKYRNCTPEEAQDYFIDAVLIFKEKVENGKVTYLSSLQTFLYKICENNYLARLKANKSKNKKLSDLEFYYYSSDHVADEDTDFMELLSNAAKAAWESLGEKCKDIISYFYIDKLRMEQIARLMGFSSANVAKTTKSRCYKQLVSKAKEVVSESGNG